MTSAFQPWIRTALIVIGGLIFVAIFVFLYLLIAGTDESRRRKRDD